MVRSCAGWSSLLFLAHLESIHTWLELRGLTQCNVFVFECTIEKVEKHQVYISRAPGDSRGLSINLSVTHVYTSSLYIRINSLGYRSSVSLVSADPAEQTLADFWPQRVWAACERREQTPSRCWHIFQRKCCARRDISKLSHIGESAVIRVAPKDVRPSVDFVLPRKRSVRRLDELDVLVQQADPIAVCPPLARWPRRTA